MQFFTGKKFPSDKIILFFLRHLTNDLGIIFPFIFSQSMDKPVLLKSRWHAFTLKLQCTNNNIIFLHSLNTWQSKKLWIKKVMLALNFFQCNKELILTTLGTNLSQPPRPSMWMHTWEAWVWWKMTSCCVYWALGPPRGVIMKCS